MWATKAYCDMDQETLECYSCQSPASTDEAMPGLCTHIELSASNQIYKQHDSCVSAKWNAVPSLGLTGKYCTCVKPSSDEYDDTTFPALYQDDSEGDITNSDTNDNENNENNEEEILSSETNVVELTNDDFKYGTYRITQPGTYKIMEDIELDMNSPDNFDSPNGKGNWWPTSDQSAEYNGMCCFLFFFLFVFRVFFFVMNVQG